MSRSNDIAGLTTSILDGVTATEVGLGNVDNTSDANKPVSTAQQTALNAKASLSGATFTGDIIGPNTFWASGSISQAMQLTRSIYYDASTNPYVVWNTGSDASVSGAGNNFVQGTNTDDLKFKMAGIYLILCTFNFQHGSSSERAIYVTLRDTDNSDATLAVAKTQVSYLDGNMSRATATLSYIGKRDANSQTNITITSATQDDADLDSQSYLNYYLLQRTAS